jgi:hypothetical protein
MERLDTATHGTGERTHDGVKLTTSVEAQTLPQQIYDPRSRLHNSILCAGLPLTFFAAAIWFTDLAVAGPGLKSGAGVTVGFILFIALFVVLGAYSTRVTWRATKCGVDADRDGITIHNLTNDIRIAWDDVASFDVTLDDGGGFRGPYGIRPNPSPVARVKLLDGTSHMMHGIRYSRWLAPKFVHEPNRRVEERVDQLTSLLWSNQTT